MRAHLSDNYDNDFPQRLLKLGGEKITSLSTNRSSGFDYRLGHIVHKLEHLIDAIYPGLENVLERKYYHWLFVQG